MIVSPHNEDAGQLHAILRDHRITHLFCLATGAATFQSVVESCNQICKSICSPIPREVHQEHGAIICSVSPEPLSQKSLSTISWPGLTKPRRTCQTHRALAQGLHSPVKNPKVSEDPTERVTRCCPYFALESAQALFVNCTGNRDIFDISSLP